MLQNIIKECQRQGVSRLVYVSSYNAIWDNVTAYEGGTEADVTYVSQPACTDPYSVSTLAQPCLARTLQRDL